MIGHALLICGAVSLVALTASEAIGAVVRAAYTHLTHSKEGSR